VPRIVLHGKHKTTLQLDEDQANIGIFNVHDTNPNEARLATDDEIEACVTSLSPKQLRKIMTEELFAPIVNKLYEAQEELVAETPQYNQLPVAVEILPAKVLPLDKDNEIPFEVGDRVTASSYQDEIGIVSRVEADKIWVKFLSNEFAVWFEPTSLEHYIEEPKDDLF